MVEVDKVYESKIKFSGIFDFKEVYNYIFMWLSDYGYGFIEETKYSEKIKPEGKEMEIIWNARKKVSDYFRFYINMRWIIIGMTTVDIEKAGVKTRANKGTVEIKFTGFLEKDYEHRWETSAASKFLRGLYDRYLIKSRIEDYERKIMLDVDELVATVKSYLELEGIKQS